MCDHMREKKMYRNMIYCKECNMVLGPVKGLKYIRYVKQENSNKSISELEIFQKSGKLKLEHNKSIENIVM